MKQRKEPVLRLIDRLPEGIERMLSLELYSSGDYGFTDRARTMLGMEPDYGHLTAYMIRRFGYPNQPGDPGKELTGGWRLATGKPDMILTVRPCPSAGNMVSLNFTASVPMEAMRAFRSWLEAPQLAWKSAIFAQIEDEGLPDCLDRAKTLLQGSPFLLGETWQDVARALPIFTGRPQMAEKGEPYKELCAIATEWETIFARHARQTPMPPWRERGPDWKDWPESDPQKPYMEALQAAFDDLKRPVFVRDVAIGIGGVIPNGGLVPGTVVDETPTSVYPVGRLVHGDPEAFGDLLSLAHRLGAGDVSAGIREIVAQFNDPEPEGAGSEGPAGP